MQTEIPTTLARLLSDDSRSWHVEEARSLDLAERERRREELLSARRPALSIADAYMVQWCGAALRVGRGDRVVGYKVGLTSAAMQKQIGVAEPDSGILLGSMVVPDGGTISADELRIPRVEAEVAFVLGEDLSGAETGKAEAFAAVGGVCLALEVIDSRFDLAGITLADSVADNAGAARFVLGEAQDVARLDLLGEELALRVGGREIARGRGKEILGNPILSIVWLARHLAGREAGLKSGDVVLAGAVHASIPLPCEESVSASSPRLGEVRVHVS